MPRNYAIGLGMIGLAFLLRVLGQAFVAFFHVQFLPPMAAWYSGLIPYPVLLPIQLAILLVQAKISRDMWVGTGYFATRRPQTGRMLRWLSYAYFAAMVVRYVATMTLHPERRWFTGTIPIFFHFVLAAYLYVFARYQTSGKRDDGSEK